ncbi:hypothetical protein BG003_000126 [Podila horticola]|nr:hypothetical protein BG003_000126 [Podila horticola]
MDPPILRTTTLTPAMKELIEAAASTKHCKYTTITELLEAKYKVPIDAVQVKNHISRIRAKTGCDKWERFCEDFELVCCSTFEGEFESRWKAFHRKKTPQRLSASYPLLSS